MEAAVSFPDRNRFLSQELGDLYLGPTQYIQITACCVDGPKSEFC